MIGIKLRSSSSMTRILLGDSPPHLMLFMFLKHIICLSPESLSLVFHPTIFNQTSAIFYSQLRSRAKRIILAQWKVYLLQERSSGFQREFLFVFLIYLKNIFFLFILYTYQFPLPPLLPPSPFSSSPSPSAPSPSPFRKPQTSMGLHKAWHIELLQDQDPPLTSR